MISYFRYNRSANQPEGIKIAGACAPAISNYLNINYYFLAIAACAAASLAIGTLKGEQDT